MPPSTMDALIKRHEGYRSQLYDDKKSHPFRPGDKLEGKLTGGYGHNFTDNDLMQEIADALFEADRKTAVATARRLFPNYTALNEPRRAVLTDMAFALGPTKLAGFKRMIAAVLAEDWKTAVDELLDSHWADEVGTRAIENAEILRTGQWRGDFTA